MVVEIKTLVLSALPYVHGIPHLGNLTGSILPADAYFKFLKLKGEEAIYICGSDEHGAQIELDATKQGRKPGEIASENHEIVKGALLAFGCTFTHYGRTHCEENKEATHEIFNGLRRNGYVIEKTIRLPYCKKCGKHLPDRYVEGKCPVCGGVARGDQCDSCGRILNPEEVVEPHCNICNGKELEFRETKHLFIDLPKLEGKLREWIARNDSWPANARNLSLELLNRGLEPRCITRDLKWGFSVPLKGYEDKIFYVWFDAPIGYIGATREWSKIIGKPDEWKSWWKGDAKQVNFLGKDNILFHTIFWPSFIIGSGLGYGLPHYIASYEFLTAKGVKFSKSRGVGLNIQTALELAPADCWRYVLISLLPETSDSEFSWDVFRELVNSELNDVFGNFVHRTFVFISKFFEGKIPECGEFDEVDRGLAERRDALLKEFAGACEKIKLREGLRSAHALAKEGNAYLSAREPWKLIKTNRQKAATCLYLCANLVRTLAIIYYPFTPLASQKIFEYLGIGKIADGALGSAGELALKPGHEIGKNIEPLFKKIEDKEIEEFRERFKG